MATETNSAMLYHFFIALQLCGAVGMGLILLTAIFSPLVKRCSTWYTFCASWIFSCLSYCLLFFAGGRDQRYQPNNKLCIAQASLIYSIPVLTSLTTFALLVHSWFNVHFVLRLPPLETYHRAIFTFLVAPFIVWIVAFLSFLAFGLANPILVSRFDNIPYCVMTSVMPLKIASLIVVVITCSMLPVQASLGLSLCQNLYMNESYRNMSVPTLKVVVRVMIFSVLTLVGFGEGVVHIFASSPGEVVDIIMACLPVSGVLIFGIQRDFLYTWMIWARLSKERLPRGRKVLATPAMTPDDSAQLT